MPGAEISARLPGSSLREAVTSATEVQWALQASLNQLLRACRAAGLDPNAAQIEHPCLSGEGDAVLLFPSYFCPDSASWLRVLAFLVTRGLPVRLLILHPDPADVGQVLAMARLFPRFDAETMALLRAFSPARADTVEDLGERIENAFRLLRQGAPGFLDDEDQINPASGEDGSA